MPAISTGLAIGLGAISAGTSIAGGLIARSGANRQAEAAERSSREAVAENRRQFDLTRADLAPWISTGSDAIRTLGFLLGLGPDPNRASTTAGIPSGIPPGGIPFEGGERDFPRGPRGPRSPTLDSTLAGPGFRQFTSTGTTGQTVPGVNLPAGDFGALNRDFTLADFEADPGYAFRLAEGQKALERSAAAAGGLFSGRQLKDTIRYGQDFASNELTNAFNRFEHNRAGRFNRYANLAGVGQLAATDLGRFGADNARTIGDIIIGGATSAAASRAAGSNALAQGITGGIGQGLSWYLLSQLGRQ